MIKVTGPRILVRPEKFEEIDEVYKAAKKAGLELYRGEDFKREERAVVFGTVLQTTNECWQAPVGNGTAWAKVGDKIVYARYAGKYITDPMTKEEFLILNDEDVIGLVLESESV